MRETALGLSLEQEQGDSLFEHSGLARIRAKRLRLCLHLVLVGLCPAVVVAWFCTHLLPLVTAAPLLQQPPSISMAPQELSQPHPLAYSSPHTLASGGSCQHQLVRAYSCPRLSVDPLSSDAARALGAPREGTSLHLLLGGGRSLAALDTAAVTADRGGFCHRKGVWSMDAG